ncbi:MAG: tetratricopeptide repeat protein [Bacteroidales bacterium]|nr:tetratricopeptide repeat protein [Bacteroidales bacterium]
MKKTLFFTSLALAFLLISCGPNPEKSRMYLDTGIDYLYTSQFDEAIDYLNKAIKCDDGNYEAYYYRGCAYSNNFKKEQALKDWHKAIEIKPDYADPYFNIGLLYRRQNDYSMACYYFKLAEKYGRQNMEDYVKHCDYYE